ncbi:hypothetical protein DE146DRAFT_226847 [Phaeosphaeria sp. MPI-PUGE-AT-0046c]|nr:hypothetical protein DE146DRAFT_226847 [Phaeosphaeria sp. MPI-PUGE-AT-0046c]
MALSVLHTIGLVLGILLPVFFIALATSLIHRYRTRTNANKSSQESDPDDVSAPQGLCNEPNTLHRGTVRRQTGLPQMFNGWVQTSNQRDGAFGRGERWPSLENGPGPIFMEEAMVAMSFPVGLSAGSEDTAMKEVARKGSADESSLREAVLGAGEDGERSGVAKIDCVKQIDVDEAMNKKIKGNESSIAGTMRKTRGYSGAWP